MKKSIQNQSPLISLIFILIVLLPCVVFSSDDIVQIKQAIVKKGANWTAGESWLAQLSLEQQKQLCGGRLPKINPDKVKLLSLPRLVSAPPIFEDDSDQITNYRITHI